MKRNQLTTQEETLVLDYLDQHYDTFDLEAMTKSLSHQSAGIYSDIVDFMIDLKYNRGFKWKARVINGQLAECWWNHKTHNWFTNGEIKALCERHLHPTKWQRITNRLTSDVARIVLNASLAGLTAGLLTAWLISLL